MNRTTPTEFDRTPGPRWSRKAGVLDQLVALAVVTLALATIYALSLPVATFHDVAVLLFIWPFMGVAWGLVLFRATRDGLARLAAAALVLGAGLAYFAFFGIFVGAPIPLAGGLVVGIALFGFVVAREGERKLVWFVPPVTVVVMLAVLISGVPAVARFGLAEPALTAFAREIEMRGTDAHYSGVAVSVGSFEFDSADFADGCVHLTMGYTGMLGDQPTGIAHCPDGPPPASALARIGRYQPISGEWYRWYSNSEFPFD